jgi:hypothetical protein
VSLAEVAHLAFALLSSPSCPLVPSERVVSPNRALCILSALSPIHTHARAHCCCCCVVSVAVCSCCVCGTWCILDARERKSRMASWLRVLAVLCLPPLSYTSTTTAPSGENEVLTDLLLFALACVCMIRGVSVTASKSGLRDTLLPSEVEGVSFRETLRSLVCSSSCAPQATRRMTRYFVVCLLYEPVTVIHSLLLTTRLLRHSCVPWNAFQFDIQGKGSIVARKGSR